MTTTPILIPPASLVNTFANLPPASPIDQAKDAIAKLTRPQREVLRKLLDAYDALDGVR